MRVVVLGGGGTLGNALQPHLNDHEVVLASRSSETRVDLTTGERLAETIAGSDIVVHLASDARKPEEIDVGGTERVLSVIDNQHLVYMSIVGVDRHPFPYYKAKYAAEQLIEASGVDHTIVRATQFHPFVAFLLNKTCRRRMAFVPAGFVFQPIDTDEVAAAVAGCVNGPPGGLVPDLAGPEVLRIEEMARSFMEARGREAPLLRFPVPGKTGRAFREGIHTNPNRAVGVKTWAQYLDGLERRSSAG